MASPERNTRHLFERLRAMGVDLRMATNERSALGELPLGPAPFRTLEGSFTAKRVRFYTLGHDRLKFSQPRPFFDLPAIDVSDCRVTSDIERALRRGWAERIRNLESAQTWLGELGAGTEVADHGTRLTMSLSGVDGPPAQIRSQNEILLPSAGPLERRGVAGPAGRRFRPLPSLEHSSELELAMTQAMKRVATDQPESELQRPHLRDMVGPAKPSPAGPRILILDGQPADLAVAETTLAAHGFRVDAFRDTTHAIDAFKLGSYDLVLSDIQLPREDGLEFATQVQRLPGIEKLPVVLIDNRANAQHEQAARIAGASAYIPRPFAWNDLGETIADLVAHATQRRYRRYEARLWVRLLSGTGSTNDVTHSVARGGVCLRTRRDVAPGSVERYRITMPQPLAPVEVEGVVVTRVNVPGSAGALAGVQFVRFADESERHWIRLMDALARRATRRS